MNLQELNKAWCSEVVRPVEPDTIQDEAPIRRRKSPVTRTLPQPAFRPAVNKGKENKPVRGILIIVILLKIG